MSFSRLVLTFPFFIALVLSCTSPQRALATTPDAAPTVPGPSTGGGGDVARFPGDDRVILADPFSLKRSILDDSEPGEIPMVPGEELLSEVRRMTSIAKAYGESGGRLYNYAASTNLHFFYVDQIPNLPECGARMTYPKLPSGVEIWQVACTVGHRTWIKKSLFEKMILREQALLLVHEGLRRASPALSNDTIAKITTGLGILSDHLNRQLLGGREQMKAEEIAFGNALIEEFAFSGVNDGKPVDRALAPRPPYVLLPTGGVVLTKREKLQEILARVHPTAFIGVGTALWLVKSVGKGAELIWTNVCHWPGGTQERACAIGENTRIQRSSFSYVGQAQIGSRVVIDNSSFFNTPNFTIGDDTQLRNCRLSNSDGLEIGARGRWQDVQINGVPDWQDFITEADVTLTDLKLELRNSVEVRKGTTLARISNAVLGAGLQDWGGAFAGAFRSMRMVFMPGTLIDLKNRIACSFGQNDFIPDGGRYYEIRNEQELVDSCNHRQR